MSVTLAPLGRGDFNRVAHLRVAPDQEKFSGQVSDAFEADERDVDFHLIADTGAVVGFFKIDRGYHHRFDFAAPGDLGLRAFLIDHGLQGRGLATAAVRALPAYLGASYRGAPTLWLTVNLGNPAAIACYLRGGFADTGERHLQGSAGPQHVFRMELAAADASPLSRSRARETVFRRTHRTDTC